MSILSETQAKTLERIFERKYTFYLK